MHLRRRTLLQAAPSALLTASLANAEPTSPSYGDWYATLDVGARQLRLRLNISEGPRAALYSLDQGGTAIPASEVRLDSNRLHVSWSALGAKFQGTLTEGKISGQFTQGQTFPLVFSRTPTQSNDVEIIPLTQQRLIELRQKSGSPALIAAALGKSGKQIALVDGIRMQGHRQPAQITDKWHLGSCTKSMTATLIARLVDAGQISWRDTIGSTLAKTVPGIRSEYLDANFLHLLSHRAGLAANIGSFDLLKFPRENADPRADRSAYAKLVLSTAPRGAKEAHFEYSNSGYVIAGAMIEAKLGSTWETLIKQHVFDPLEMQGAGFGAPGTQGAVDQPVGHNVSLLGTLSPFPPGSPITDNPAVLGPAGRVHATMDNVQKYLVAHANMSPFLTRASWNALHTPPFGGNYALGWERRKEKIWHNGTNTLWYAEITADLARGTVAAAAANDGRLQSAQPAVANALKGAMAAVT